MTKKSIIFILIILRFFISCIPDTNIIINNNLKKEIPAWWKASWAVGASPGKSYSFFTNGYFFYTDEVEKQNLLAKYHGSFGKWKIEDN